MPRFLSVLHANSQNRSNAALASLIALIESVLRRTSYLVLLNENPKALSRLVKIANASPWIMRQLARHPVLLDELVMGNGLGHVPIASELHEALRQQSLRLLDSDMEGQMDMLRYFRLAHHLHIVAAETTGALPLMKVSDYLSFLAESILTYVLQLSWAQMLMRYGAPMVNGKAETHAKFAIIAYGKLGGIELSYGSDVDLVFLYDTDNNGQTNGDKPIDNSVFYTRMGQRIIHLLTTRTMLGDLYEVDMRLRPSGAKGLLVSTVGAFQRYQQQQAWTWEHQALVRGRPIAGDPLMIQRFTAIRHAVLCQSRDSTHLRQEVLSMREKMHDHLAPTHTKFNNATLFHLKHSRGGIVDIEFMVQYWVLAYSAEKPVLTQYTDNIRIIESLVTESLLSKVDGGVLIRAYQAYRSASHRQALREEKNELPSDLFTHHRQQVSRIWDSIFG